MHERAAKPLGGKAYGSIPHMPGSKRGPGDHGIDEQQASIITGEPRRGMRVYVQEKLDGTCMSVAKIDGQIVALGRKGHPASGAPYEHMRAFATWVAERRGRFDRLLSDGERVVGEWLLMATSIRYRVLDADALFVAFDIMREGERALVLDVEDQCEACRVDRVGSLCLVDDGRSIFPIRDHERLLAQCLLAQFGGRRDVETDERAEGLVYRVERWAHDGEGGSAWKHSFIAKWTRSDFEPGKLLVGAPNGAPETASPVWNQNPWRALHAQTMAAPAGAREVSS